MAPSAFGRLHRRAGRRLAATVTVAAALTGCTGPDGRAFNPLDAVVPDISLDDERELGREFDAELRKSVPVIDELLVADFINELGQALVSGIEPQPFIYRFRVIDADSLNAFAVPGGYIYFHSATILAVSSVDELAGVMGHEIAHVKKRHYKQMREQSQIPDILVGLAGIAAAAATGEPGFVVATQAANVAMKLKYSRAYETEADRFGSVFAVRAGYEPTGSTRFFERILDEQHHHPDDLPPYLFSHPDVEDRIGAIEIAARSLRPTQQPEPDLEPALKRVQARLAALVGENRTNRPTPNRSHDRIRAEPALAEAEALAAAGAIDAALLRLGQAAARNPDDPRIPYQTAQLLFDAERYREATVHYRYTLLLDASRAKVFYKLGLAHKELGERHRAVFALEQATMRAGETSALRERAEWEVEKLTFPVVSESGFADGSEGSHDTPVGRSLATVPAGTRRLAWWAEIHPRYRRFAETFTLRLRDPEGRVMQAVGIDTSSRRSLTARFDLDAGLDPGTWTAELWREGERLGRWPVRVEAR